jgi:hypothetical protein
MQDAVVLLESRAGGHVGLPGRHVAKAIRGQALNDQAFYPAMQLILAQKTCLNSGEAINADVVVNYVGLQP